MQVSGIIVMCGLHNNPHAKSLRVFAPNITVIEVIEMKGLHNGKNLRENIKKKKAASP